MVHSTTKFLNGHSDSIGGTLVEDILIQRAADIDWTQLGDIKRVGVTAGASAPEILVEEVIEAHKPAHAGYILEVTA